MITLPYCFCNTEVRAVVKLHWDRWKLVRWEYFDIFISVNLCSVGIESNLCNSGRWELSTSPLWPTPWLLPLDTLIRLFVTVEQCFLSDIYLHLWSSKTKSTSWFKPFKSCFVNGVTTHFSPINNPQKFHVKIREKIQNLNNS